MRGRHSYVLIGVALVVAIVVVALILAQAGRPASGWRLAAQIAIFALLLRNLFERKPSPEARLLMGLGVAVMLVGLVRVAFGVFLLEDTGRSLLSMPETLAGARGRLPLVWNAALVVAGICLGHRRSWARYWVIGAALVDALLRIALPLAFTGDPAAALARRFVTPIGRFEVMPFLGTITLCGVAAVLVFPAGRKQFSPPRRWARWPLVAAPAYALVAAWPLSHRLASERSARWERQRIRDAVVQPGSGTLRLRVAYAGGSLDGFDGRDAWIGLRDRQSGAWRDISARTHSGMVEASAVPTGVYDVFLAIDADDRSGLGPSSVGLPGDLASTRPVVALLLEPGDEELVDVPTARIIRLQEPEDSLDGVSRGAIFTWRPRDLAHLASPVRFVWDALPGARGYWVRVDMQRLDANARPIELARRRVDGTTWEIELPPTEPGVEYRFAVAAEADPGLIGVFKVQGKDWYGSAYPFVVGPPPPPDPLDSQVWLMLPPILDPGQVGTDVPIDHWCPYEEYVSPTDCERAFTTLRARDRTFFGFDVRSGRCVPALDVGRPPRDIRLRDAVKREITRALGARGTMVEAPATGPTSQAWLAVKVQDGVSAGTAPLAIDIADANTAASEKLLAARATKGYAEYWRVRPASHPGTMGVVEVWRDPEPSVGRWRSHRTVTGSTPKHDAEGRLLVQHAETPLPLAADPQAVVTVERLVPWPCS